MENKIIEENMNGNKKFKFPHVYVIIMSITLIAAFLTYVVPAGQFERVEDIETGREIVVSGTFSFVEQNPVGPFEFLMSFFDGLLETADIVFFIFIVGGSFAVVESTGALTSVIGNVTKKMYGRERLIIPVVMLVFSIGGATFGMAESCLPFIPIMVLLCISLGFDSLTGVAIVLAGAGAGFSGAIINPFTIGVAQGISELPLYSGWGLRIALYLGMVSLTIVFVYRYAGKIKKNPELSPMHALDVNREEKLDLSVIPEMTGKDITVIVIMMSAIISFVVGVLKFGWYFREMCAVFLLMALLSALIAGKGLNGFGEALTRGMAGIAGGALIVGFARAILVILTNGQIIDTILNGAANLVAGMPTAIAAIGMYIFQCFLSYLVPSGSGQASISMPIMAPLADLTGLTRQTAVIVFQIADGISNIFTPTSGYFMAGLALAKIPWQKWAKFFWRLLLLQYALGIVFVIFATVINYGPF